ncbi:MAG: hypothetical protein Q4B42_06045, partial [Oscillospiraceae bacterium]|nr:hypothetical protein [Oscillospiraceae bacterium]
MTERIKNGLSAYLNFFEVWMCIPAAAAAMLGGAAVVMYADISISSFKGREIGIGVISGADPSLRKGIFFGALLVALAAAAALMLFLILFKKYRTSIDKSADFEGEKALCCELSFVLGGLLAYGFYELLCEAPFPFAFSLKLLLVLVAALGAHSLLRLFPLKHRKGLKSSCLYSALLLPVVFAFAVCRFASGSLDIISPPGVLSYIIAFALIEAGFAFGLDGDRLLKASAPLYFLPASFIIANELQYTLAARLNTILDTNSLSACLTALIFALAVYLYFAKGRKPEICAVNRLENLIFPVIIASLALYSAWSLELGWESLDYLHDGNKLVSAQQLSGYGKLPYVDFMQGQDVRLGSILYALINSAPSFEGVIWDNCLSAVLNALIAYFVLKRLIPASWLLAAFAFLPMLELCNSYYLIALLPAVYLIRLQERQRLWDYAFISFLSILCFVWMPSAGKIAVIATLAATLFISLKRERLLKLLGGYALSWGAMALVYCLICLLRGRSIADNARLVLAMGNIEFNAAGYAQILAPTTPRLLALFVYGLMPPVCLALIIVSIVNKRLGNKRVFFIFLAAAALVAATRSLARHALIESDEHYYFYPLIALVLPFAFKGLKINIKKLLNAAFCVCFCLLINVGYPPLAEALESAAFKSFGADEVRYTINEAELPQELLGVIDDYLLYVLSDKPYAAYHHVIHAAYSEQAQVVYVKELGEKYEKGELPLVLFSAEDYELSAMDGIPSCIAAFRVAEFIYENYEPCCEVDGCWLWTAKNSSLKQELLADSRAVPRESCYQFAGLLKLPYIWANYDEYAGEILSQDALYSARDISLGTDKTQIGLPSAMNKEEGN